MCVLCAVARLGIEPWFYRSWAGFLPLSKILGPIKNVIERTVGCKMGGTRKECNEPSIVLLLL